MTTRRNPTGRRRTPTQRLLHAQAALKRAEERRARAWRMGRNADAQRAERSIETARRRVAAAYDAHMAAERRKEERDYRAHTKRAPRRKFLGLF